MVNMGETIQAAEHPAAITVYSANIQRRNDDVTKLIKELKKVDADIVLLMEVTPGHVEKLREVIDTFPYHKEYSPFGKINIGTVFLSKFPIQDCRMTQLTELGNLLLEVTLDIEKTEIMFYAIHATNPSLKKYFEIRKKHFLELADKIMNATSPVIVAGDFNATPYSPMFKRLIETSGLIDSRNGFGWQPSWPTSFPLFWLPIDHILVSPDIRVHRRTTGSYIGSDHYPIIAELSVSM